MVGHGLPMSGSYSLEDSSHLGWWVLPIRGSLGKLEMGTTLTEDTIRISKCPAMPRET